MIWVIPEELRTELAGLNLETKLYYGTVYVKNAIYSVDTRWASVINSTHAKRRPSQAKEDRVLMIKIRINELLKEQERSFYWLAKETGISHTTLWRLKKDKARGITFNTLERVCKALKCEPGDVLTLGRARPGKKA